MSDNPYHAGGRRLTFRQWDSDSSVSVDLGDGDTDTTLRDIATSVSIPLLNKAGRDLAAGSTVVNDPDHDEAFELAATSAQTERTVGVLQEAIEAEKRGLVKVFGYHPAVRVSGSVSAGDKLFTVAGSDICSAAVLRDTGAFAEALEDSPEVALGLLDAELTALGIRNGDTEEPVPEDGTTVPWSGGAFSTAMKHGGSRSYSVTGASSATIVYAFGGRIFRAGVRYVVDIWRRQTTDHDTTVLTLGLNGTDDNSASYVGDVGADPVDLWEEDEVGADGQTWNRGRVEWIPTADRTGVTLEIAATGFASGDFAVDDLVLYEAAPVEVSAILWGAPDTPASAVSIVDAGGYYNGTEVEAALQEIGAGLGTGVVSAHDDLTGRDAPANHPWALRAFDGEQHQINVIDPAGATPELDIALGNIQDVTLDQAAAPNFASLTPGVECRWGVKLRGQFAVTWPAEVVWVLGSAPQPEADGYAYHEVAFACDDGGELIRAYNIAGAIAEVSVVAPAGAVGPILVADTHSSPLVFADLLQNDDGNGLLYADI